jgi:hypothetical protein
MTDDRPISMEADLDWVRRTLAASDPAGAADRPLTVMPAPSTRGLSPQPARRRPAAILVTSIAAAVLLVVGVVAVAAGIGIGRSHHPTTATGTAAVLSAYTRTVGAQSAHGSLSLTLGDASVHVDGIVDLRTGAGDLTFILPPPIGQVEAISTGQVYYVRLPPLLQAAAGGKPWVQLDRSALEGLVGNQMGVPGVGTTLDVTGVLGWLRSDSGQVATVGHDTINGVPTTHYRATVDASRAAASVGADPSTAAAVAQATGQSVPVDVWIDAQGRLRQMQVSLDLTKLHLPQGATLPAQARGTAVLTVDLWDFGVPVHATAPPADQVTDASPLIGRLGQSG